MPIKRVAPLIVLAAMLAQASVASGADSSAAPAALTAYGDSITKGAMVTPVTAYPYLLSQRLGMPLANYGFSGDQACDMVMKIWANEPVKKTGGALYTTMIGTNDAHVKGVGAYEAVYNNCLLASLSFLGVPSENRVLADNVACTALGDWRADRSTNFPSSGRYTRTKGDAMTCSLQTYGYPLYIWYGVADRWSGAFKYSVDGGEAVAVSSRPDVPILTQHGEAAGVFLIRVTGIAAGYHKVTFTSTQPTDENNVVYIAGLGTPPAHADCATQAVFNGGVPRQQHDAKAEMTSKYDADARADVALLADDGLRIYFVSVRDNVRDSDDYADTLHPNTEGHRRLSEGFYDAIKRDFLACGK